jgi:hypothetical protein
MTDLRYPIGRFRAPEIVTESDRNKAVDEIAALPAQMRAAVREWTPKQLDTPYRPDGWTVRQVIHHVPESHMNSYIRFKLALTENEPTVKAYDETAWANLPDATTAPVDVSLDLLDALHQRWVNVLRQITPSQWKRTFRHPEDGIVRLDMNSLIYAWHGKHHLAHITGLRDRMRW